ncbi:NUDIX hydrolase domain-like protein [Mycena capillaripes]|nr:NUDIX hydrolase domain-like protein [Mycena capillaripes]
MSRWSDAPVPNSSWTDENFLLGAGMVVFQPATLKVVVLYETKKKFWFLPKGRKDVGESLEQTALREAYEESGYRVDFLPLYTHTRAPGPPDDPWAPSRLNCEAIHINLTSFPARKRGNRTSPPGEYLSFWYVGQIPEDAVREEGTGMPDEVNYEAHLMDVKEALEVLHTDEARIVDYAWHTFLCVRPFLRLIFFYSCLRIQTGRRLEEERALQRAAAAGSGSESTSSVLPASKQPE